MESRTVSQIADAAKAASLVLANLPSEPKNSALEAMAIALENNLASILEANQLDLRSAKALKLSTPLMARWGRR